MADERDTRRTTADETADEAILSELRDRYDIATDEWSESRQQGAVDMRYVAGDPWDPAERKLRLDAKRPCLALDESGQHFNQVINAVRANPRSPKFAPTGNGANDEAARFYADKWREIEYRSHAQIAYLAAFENALHRGYGFVRLTTRFEHDRSRNQDLWIEDLPNPDLVLPDPLAKRPDSSDMKWCFVEEQRNIEEFKREFPKARIVDFAPFMASHPRWIQESTLTLAEYWRIVTTERELLILYDPSRPEPVGLFRDELEGRLPPGAQIIGRRPVDYPRVEQYLTNGVEILERNPWKGKYIPIVSCYGKVIYVEGKRKLLSMTRLMRDPMMFYAYVRTQQAEMAGMIPKAPVQGYEGQFEGYEDDWAKVNREPIAYLQFKGKTLSSPPGVLLPPPSRIDYHAGEHLQALELIAEAARRAIMSAAGLTPLPTAAQRRNEKSKIALEFIDDKQQQGSFHFVDHFNDTLHQLAVIGEDLMDKVLDTPRTTGIRKEDDTGEMVRINDRQAKDAKGQPAPYISTKGSYLVTISIGNNTNSERQEASELVDTLITSPVMEMVEPPKRPKLLGASLRAKNLGARVDAIADIIDPPEDQQDPQQAAQQAQQMQQQLQMAEAALKEAGQIIQTKQVETDSRERIAAAQIASQEKIADMESERRAATAISVAHIGAAAKGLAIDAHASEEAQALGHEADEAERGRQFEAALAEQDRQAALEQADMEQQHALEQGAQGHAQALEAQQQQVALQPPAPEMGV